MSPVYGVNLEIYISDFDAFCKIENNLTQNASYWLYLNGEMVTDVVVPEWIEPTVDETQHSPFYYCASMKSITLPNNFKYCYFDDSADSLGEVTVGSSIESIKLYMNTITRINCYAQNPPSLNMFDTTYSSVIAHVPVGTKEKYVQAQGWNNVGAIIDDLTGDSGIDDIIINDNQYEYQFYNMNGIPVNNKYLTPGLYIRKSGKQSEKVFVR